jgi:PEP-CTERM motif
MDRLKGVCRSAVVLAALVLVVSVAGAFADGVHGDHDGTFVRYDSSRTWFNPTSYSHDGWSFGKTDSNRVFKDVDGRWSKNWSGDTYDGWSGKTYSDVQKNSSDPTATPEPGTVLLLGMGVLLCFTVRRRAMQV